MALCVSVAIDDVISKIDKLYDYCVPEQFIGDISVGVRVVVPFSKSNITKKAVVLNVFDSDNCEKLKSVISVVDNDPVINEFQVELLKLLKSNYFITHYKAFKTIVPRGIDYKINQKYFALDALEQQDSELYSVIKSKKNGIKIEQLPKHLIKSFKDQLLNGNVVSNIDVSLSDGRSEKYLSLNIEKEQLEEYIANTNPRFESQRDLMRLFLDYNELSCRDALYYSGCSMSTVNTLVKKGVIATNNKKIINNPYNDLERKFELTPISLTVEQANVFENIKADFGNYSTHLMHGVTGSGKTLVYISLIDEVINQGKSAIFMVPEISLTPQTLARFYSRYGDKVAVVHSGLSPRERADEWKKIKSLDSAVVVGTRSSVFAPVNNLGIVIIDEEHESSYKSESSPRFHARDISKFICKHFKVPLVLGSATPLIESFYFAKKGIYKYHKLAKRYNDNPLPQTEIIDMCTAYKEGEQSFLSYELKEAIEQTLDKNEQTILFLNRRGANTVVGCRSCGYIAKCPNCNVSLTYHSANNRLMCHYCGHSIRLFDKCPECESEHIKKLGIGTQLVYSEIQDLFPNARILRMDFDTVDSYISYGDKLNDFKNGKYDIMLGTQMVAKGLDFPNVTLVGVVNADISLHFDDFRANERTFSLLTQVCGRSGRAGKEGRALIQTYSYDNEVINFAKMQDYDLFYDYEIKFRKALLYPPFCDLVSFTVSSLSQNQSMVDAKRLFDYINQKSNNEYSDIPFKLLNPVAPKIVKFNNKYRCNLLIKTKAVKKLYLLLDEINEFFETNTKSELTINVNPLNNI